MVTYQDIIGFEVDVTIHEANTEEPRKANIVTVMLAKCWDQ